MLLYNQSRVESKNLQLTLGCDSAFAPAPMTWGGLMSFSGIGPDLGPWPCPGPCMGPGPPGPIGLGAVTGSCPMLGLGPCSGPIWGPLAGRGPRGPKSPAGPGGRVTSGRMGPGWGAAIWGPGTSGLRGPRCGPRMGGGPARLNQNSAFTQYKFARPCNNSVIPYDLTVDM